MLRKLIRITTTGNRESVKILSQFTIATENQQKLLIINRKSFGTKPLSLYFCTPKKGKVDLVAQLVEQYTFNVWALGSSPSGITKAGIWPAFFVCRTSRIVHFKVGLY